MKLIPLTQGKFAMVDDEDYEQLAEFKWYFKNGYAQRGTYPDGRYGRQVIVYMHRSVYGECQPHSFDREVDHIDGDKLNNQKSNLRIATRSQNNANKRRAKNNKSGFRGVSFKSKQRRWVAQICVNKHKKHLGYFDSPAEAHEAYKAAASKYFGEFANFGE